MLAVEFKATDANSIHHSIKQKQKGRNDEDFSETNFVGG